MSRPTVVLRSRETERAPVEGVRCPACGGVQEATVPPLGYGQTVLVCTDCRRQDHVLRRGAVPLIDQARVQASAQAYRESRERAPAERRARAAARAAAREARRYQTITCACCGVTQQRRRTSGQPRRYCSDRCRVLAYKRRLAQEVAA